MEAWSTDSWKNYPIKQQPAYPDPVLLEQTLAQLRRYPSLVFAGEVEYLKQLLAEAAQGRRFLLQGGDCAERFKDCTNEAIVDKLKILLQMSLVLTYGLRKAIIRVGRIAGQYAKPRSYDFETVAGRELSVYRGDSINSFEPDPAGRIPDPRRMLQSYYHSSTTINYIRALIEGGFADLHHPENWQLESFSTSGRKKEYLRMVKRITDAVQFMESLGSVNESVLGKINFFTSHEGLLLRYEEALTYYDLRRGKYYNLSAHSLWIGERTRQIDGAHVEYFRGIANPIGVKIGPSCGPEELVDLLNILNPLNEWGRITLITRLGQDKIARTLPPLLEAVSRHGLHVLWCCDPMHGNTLTTSNGVKTRDFNQILSELRQSFEIHRSHNTWLGGVHFELTGEDVTECTGGVQGLLEEDLSVNYETYCDPRLNYVQSLEMAFQIAGSRGE
ncbi:MAG: class II 3-deoxy-7-phosphoheptulonate synthase [bacterium]